MPITYTSSIVPTRVQLERGSDGRERIAVATLDTGYFSNATYGGQRWNLELVHPSGFRRTMTLIGTADEAERGLQVMRHEEHQRFVEEGRRGDQPPYEKHPLACSVPVPSSPTISMPSLSLRYKT